jgi:hypothetical protein
MNTTKPSKRNKAATPSRGRPKACAERLIGFKLKVGSKYVHFDKIDRRTKSGVAGLKLVDTMSEGSMFESKSQLENAESELIEKKMIRKWGKSFRTQVLPRYS